MFNISLFNVLRGSIQKLPMTEVLHSSMAGHWLKFIHINDSLKARIGNGSPIGKFYLLGRKHDFFKIPPNYLGSVFEYFIFFQIQAQILKLTPTLLPYVL